MYISIDIHVHDYTYIMYIYILIQVYVRLNEVINHFPFFCPLAILPPGHQASLQGPASNHRAKDGATDAVEMGRGYVSYGFNDGSYLEYMALTIKYGGFPDFFSLKPIH